MKEFYEDFEAYQITAVNYADPECKIYRRIIIAIDFNEAVEEGQKYFESKDTDRFVVGVIKLGDAVIPNAIRIHLLSGHFDYVDTVDD